MRFFKSPDDPNNNAVNELIRCDYCGREGPATGKFSEWWMPDYPTYYDSNGILVDDLPEQQKHHCFDKKTCDRLCEIKGTQPYRYVSIGKTQEIAEEEFLPFPVTNAPLKDSRDEDAELIEEILAMAADEDWFDNEFVMSVKDQLEEKGSISSAQRNALLRIEQMLLNRNRRK